MKVLNFGSMNFDYVYQVEHFVQAGETLSSLSMETNCGGKGLNQSIALAKAGVQVYHAGLVGAGGEVLKEKLSANGVDVTYLHGCDTIAGHAIIQVNREGQNCILLYNGSNYALTKAYIDEVFENFENGDLLLIQNEMNEIPYIMQKASDRGMQIAFNPSPISTELMEYPLDFVRWFILNEIEGEALTGENEPDKIAHVLLKRYPNAAIVLTLGKKGVIYRDRDKSESFGIFNVNVVDSTAAGDTFTGYFLAGIVKRLNIRDALQQASAASSLAVSKKGAADSIPGMNETIVFLKNQVLQTK